MIISSYILMYGAYSVLITIKFWVANMTLSQKSGSNIFIICLLAHYVNSYIFDGGHVWCLDNNKGLGC